MNPNENLVTQLNNEKLGYDSKYYNDYYRKYYEQYYSNLEKYYNPIDNADNTVFSNPNMKNIYKYFPL